MSSTGQTRNLALIVGANLRAARDSLSLTQRELAQSVGGKTDAQRISDWERGVNRPSDLNLVRLARILERDLAWFYTDHSLPDPSDPEAAAA